MRIAIWHNLPSGGGKRALYDQVRGLVERGHEVEAWCPPSVDQAYLPLGELITEHVLPMPWRPSYHRSVLDHVLHPRPDILRGHAAMERHAQLCAREIAAGSFDLLLAHSCQYLFPPPIGRYVHLPSVLYLQEPRRMNYEAAPELPWIGLPRERGTWWTPRGLRARMSNAGRLRRVRADARLELENARSFDQLLVNSYFSRESILRAYGPSIDARVCYLGVDTDLFVPRGLPREDIVVGLGSIAPAKNITFIVEALARLPQPRPALVWVGYLADTAYAEQVTKLAHRLGVPFEAKTRVTDDELVDIFNRARLMAYAPHLEPFGFAPLEANACGLPVVGVAEGGLRETIIDGINGLVVETDPEAMAQAIDRLRADTAYAEQLGQSGRRVVVERWSLPASLDRLERRLSDVVASHGGNTGNTSASDNDLGDGDHGHGIEQSPRIKAGS